MFFVRKYNPFKRSGTGLQSADTEDSMTRLEAVPSSTPGGGPGSVGLGGVGGGGGGAGSTQRDRGPAHQAGSSAMGSCVGKRSKASAAEKELQHLSCKIEKLLANLDEGERDDSSFPSGEECVVCLSAKASMQTQPCGHRVVCRLCFVKTIQAAVAQRTLPLRCVVCRTKILKLKQQVPTVSTASTASAYSTAGSRSRSATLDRRWRGAAAGSAAQATRSGQPSAAALPPHPAAAHHHSPLRLHHHVPTASKLMQPLLIYPTGTSMDRTSEQSHYHAAHSCHHHSTSIQRRAIPAWSSLSPTSLDPPAVASTVEPPTTASPAAGRSAGSAATSAAASTRVRRPSSPSSFRADSPWRSMAASTAATARRSSNCGLTQQHQTGSQKLK